MHSSVRTSTFAISFARSLFSHCKFSYYTMIGHEKAYLNFQLSNRLCDRFNFSLQAILFMLLSRRLYWILKILERYYRDCDNALRLCSYDWNQCTIKLFFKNVWVVHYWLNRSKTWWQLLILYTELSKLEPTKRNEKLSFWHEKWFLPSYYKNTLGIWSNSLYWFTTCSNSLKISSTFLCWTLTL